MSITTDWITLGGIVAILMFLWNLHRDIRALSDRVSRMEGRMSGMEGQMTGLQGQINMLIGMSVREKEAT